MIYLIGGAPGAGKSTLANALSKEKHIDVIEIDALMKDFNAQIPKGDFALKLPVWNAKSMARIQLRKITKPKRIHTGLSYVSTLRLHLNREVIS